MADNVTTEELELALLDLAESMGQSVVEYVQGQGYETVEQVNSKIASVQSQINAIVAIDEGDGVETLAEKIAAINAVLSDDNGVIQQIYTKILENKQSVLDEVTRATAAEAALQAQITANAAKTVANESAITTLNGASDVVGSVANKIKTETDRATAAEASLQAQIDTLTGGATGSLGDLAGRVTDVETAVAAEAATRAQEIIDTLAAAKAYTDANVLKASSMNICGLKNKFRTALGLADVTCGGDTPDGGDGAVI